MEIRATLAANLRSARKARGFSQEELAHRVGIDRTYVSSLERCLYSASIDLVARLAAALDMEPEALLSRPPTHPPSGSRPPRGRARA